MPIYDAQSTPEKVYSSTKDPEIVEWLKTGPVFGAHKPIHIQRCEHDAFVDEVKPPIGERGSILPAGEPLARLHRAFGDPKECDGPVGRTECSWGKGPSAHLPTSPSLSPGC
jgi:hypothetical protein